MRLGPRGPARIGFRRLLRKIIQQDRTHAHLPDYSIEMSEDGNQIIFRKAPPLPRWRRSRRRFRRSTPTSTTWRGWATEVPRSPEMAFLDFCRRWFEKRGRP